MKGGCIDLDEMLSEIAELKKQNKSLGERCLQLQKDKGKLIDYNKKLLQENTDQHNKIVLLSKKVNYLQKENAKVEEIKANADYQIEGRDLEIKELKAQIEKMKCCENCGWYYLQQHWRESKEINESRMFHCGTCGNKRNWKLREIKEK
jgi:DNA-directed RNA polymerase subunit M/transcription elongation factor TFIIS